MSDDAQRWKDKYLASLEQQEKLERRWDARLDLLRRSLVRSSLAAEGADKAVDQCMQDLREILRRDDIDVSLAALVPRLERAVLDSEQQRGQRIAQVASALAALVEPLLALELPREVRKPLKSFAKRLHERTGQVREWPALLAELAQLQQQALAEHEQAPRGRAGLLQRWFGGRDGGAVTRPLAPPGDTVLAAAAATPGLPQVASQAAPEQAEAVALASPLTSAPLDSLPAPADLLPHEQRPDPGPEAEPGVEAEPEQEPTALAVLPGLAAPEQPPGQGAEAEYALPAPPEPGYSAIANHVEATLLGLLDELPLPERHQAQAELLAERIRAGLNMYELVPVLDDLAVLMLAIADVGQRDFEAYLKQLNERLSTFQGSLEDAHEGYADSINVARELDSELRQQVDGLHSSVRQATDLGSLKELVESRLNGLLDTMQQYQRQRDERDQSVGGRLQTLVERVAHMEQEAKGFRQHLEEQRQKALLDPLTGLPNRAAWSERLDLELARWQRYGGDLLLAMVDIDHFKRINDAYGHLAGDKVLKIIAQELRKRLRKIDFIARFGGEEFVLLLPSTPLEGGLQLLETLREGIESCPFHFRGERVSISLSAGISAFAEGEHSDLVLERADQALYRAKRGGRNRVEPG
ncbi:diguanylate cyclase [Pseudomonas benzenivorans]|uniref:diguanylate cyclase n=1 Tax=Pseudomonas benzenivorans TaxID=556533 RepID=A0ABY5H321_9PSED|nr:diguanylate cyclase [Pseudomonas benzenivorans]UTW06033.1 diguanylate cyclase [Pseudomonas benzenivorans]